MTVFTPTGTLGYGFGAKALARGMSLLAAVIAVDAGSTIRDHTIADRADLVSRLSMKQELAQLIRAGRQAQIPVIVGSAGGSGSRAQWTGR